MYICAKLSKRDEDEDDDAGIHHDAESRLMARTLWKVVQGCLLDKLAYTAAAPRQITLRDRHESVYRFVKLCFHRSSLRAERFS